jgi:hypothetical protein
MGEYAKAVRSYTKGLTICKDECDRAGEGRCIATACVRACCMLPPAGSRTWMESLRVCAFFSPHQRALGQAVRVTDDFLARHTASLGLVFLEQGLYDRAIEFINSGLETVRQVQVSAAVGGGCTRVQGSSIADHTLCMTRCRIRGRRENSWLGLPSRIRSRRAAWRGTRGTSITGESDVSHTLIRLH